MKLIRYLNHYKCSGTDHHGEHEEVAWNDESSSENNDKCPECNAEIEPYESEELETDDSGKGDIIIQIKGGQVIGCNAPAGLSVLVLDYDVDNADGEDLARDEDGDECVPEWIVEPGAANADETPAFLRPAVPEMDVTKRLLETLTGVMIEATSFARGHNLDRLHPLSIQLQNAFAEFPELAERIRP